MYLNHVQNSNMMLPDGLKLQKHKRKSVIQEITYLWNC